MNRLKALSLGLGMLLAGTSIAHSAEQMDFSNMDCNEIQTRKMLMAGFNYVFRDKAYRAVDAYDQKTLGRGVDKFICVGKYLLSTSQVVEYTYEYQLNSVGEPITSFKNLKVISSEW
ncbi:MAG TPA: hypothetical protein VGL07_16740 [Buttiauxella sp.]|jgi:hypothetical protein